MATHETCPSVQRKGAVGPRDRELGKSDDRTDVRETRNATEKEVCAGSQTPPDEKHGSPAAANARSTKASRQVLATQSLTDSGFLLLFIWYYPLVSIAFLVH